LLVEFGFEKLFLGKLINELWLLVKESIFSVAADLTKH